MPSSIGEVSPWVGLVHQGSRVLLDSRNNLRQALPQQTRSELLSCSHDPSLASIPSSGMFYHSHCCPMAVLGFISRFSIGALSPTSWEVALCLCAPSLSCLARGLSSGGAQVTGLLLVHVSPILSYPCPKQVFYHLTLA